MGLDPAALELGPEEIEVVTLEVDRQRDPHHGERGDRHREDRGHAGARGDDRIASEATTCPPRRPKMSASRLAFPRASCATGT